MTFLIGLLIGGFVGCIIGLFIAACGKNNREQDLENENFYLNCQLEESEKIIEALHKKYKVNRMV